MAKQKKTTKKAVAPKTPAWEKSTHPLAVAMRKKGISQRWLAEEAGIQQADLSRVLTGGRPRFAAGTAAKLYPIVREWKVKMEDLILPPKAA